MNQHNIIGAARVGIPNKNNNNIEKTIAYFRPNTSESFDIIVS